MIIEIHKPELENLIRERMESGGFQDLEDVLMRALKSSSTGEQAAAQAEENPRPVPSGISTARFGAKPGAIKRLSQANQAVNGFLVDTMLSPSSSSHSQIRA
jgi:hypothetical protein